MWAPYTCYRQLQFFANLSFPPPNFLRDKLFNFSAPSVPCRTRRQTKTLKGFPSVKSNYGANWQMLKNAEPSGTTRNFARCCPHTWARTLPYCWPENSLGLHPQSLLLRGSSRNNSLSVACVMDPRSCSHSRAMYSWLLTLSILPFLL